MPSGTEQSVDSFSGEPWGRRLWLGLAAVLIVTTCICSYGISTWPMADDEVPSLVEMGLLTVSPSAFSVPASQIGRLPRAMPVWYQSQRWIIDRLGATELSYRLPALCCAILTSGLAFVLAARWRGLWFAAALAIVLNGAPLFVLISQLDRFYSLPLLLLTATLGLILTPAGGIAGTVATAVLTTLAVLSHNMTVPVFGLAFGASCAGYMAGRAPWSQVLRSGVAAAVGVAIYFLYLKPLVSGWASTGNPTPALVSFVANAGVAVFALSVLGVWAALVRRDSIVWWAMIFIASLCFFPIAPVSWNPRYFLFFMPAMWVLAAYVMELVARRFTDRSTALAWYGCIIAMLIPGLLSHFRDGSRHDYRQAAGVLMSHARPGQQILSDDAETISYYLPEAFRERLQVRTKVRVPPPDEFFLVTRSNAWMPLPQIPGRNMDLLAEIYKRRFDEFSHILRVYRVTAAAGQ